MSRNPLQERPTAIVVTTINVPYGLEAIVGDLEAHGHCGVEVIVIGDLQTPREAAEFCGRLDRRGIAVSYWGPDEQRAFLRPFPGLARLLPWRSIQRRNVGYLVAMEREAEVIISIDDDNFLHDADLLGGHLHVGTEVEVELVDSASGWFNVCSLLETDPPRRFYHRGFPFSRRFQDEPCMRVREKRRVAVNAGLWLGDPDVDTVTRLEEPFRVTGLRSPPSRIGLMPGTWSPFNSQNTAMLRDLLPFLYLIVADGPRRGLRASFRNFRYDDIWMSYFARAAMDRMGDVVTYGTPLVVQEREPRNFLLDLDRELLPMMLTENLVESLRGLSLGASSYMELHKELIESLRECVRSSELSADDREFLARVVDGVEIWRDICVQIGA